jgi:hypothetical protein
MPARRRLVRLSPAGPYGAGPGCAAPFRRGCGVR